jgi:site-specific recombinase XerD
VGTIRKRGKVWYIDYRVNGRRIKNRIGLSKKVAELRLKDIEVKIAKNEFGFLPKDSDIEKLLADFKEYSTTNHSPATIKRYKAITDHFRVFLKQYPYITKISQLTAKTFEDYKTYRKRQEAEAKTINIELQTLKSMFSMAIKWGYATVNPLQNVDKLKMVQKKYPRFLSEEECDKLLSTCAPWLYPIFYTFLRTGMRKQELMNLEWADVDFERGKIKIRVKEGWVPKTSEREIPMSNGVSNVLKKHKEETGQWNLVFHDGNGNKIENNKLRKQLMRVTKQCGFPDVTKLHTLRHTFASHLVMKGVDLPTIKQLLGHSDITTTMIYSHLAPDHLVQAVDKLD